MSFAVGSLVTARGREWVVLPDSDPDNDLLVLRPLGGSDEEIAGIYLPLESVEAAEFDRAADPDAGFQWRHDESMIAEDQLPLEIECALGQRGVVAALGVEWNAQTCDRVDQARRPGAGADDDTVGVACGAVGKPDRWACFGPLQTDNLGFLEGCPAAFRMDPERKGKGLRFRHGLPAGHEGAGDEAG